MTIAAVLAAGSGSRMQWDQPKQFVSFRGEPLLLHSLRRFDQHPKVDQLIVSVAPDYIHLTQELLEQAGLHKPFLVIEGGARRCDSSMAVVQSARALAQGKDKLLIHDAARPFVSQQIIHDIIDALETCPVAGVAFPVTDTIYETREDQSLGRIPARSSLMAAQTPQGAWIEAWIHVAQAFQKSPFEASDDISLFQHFQIHPIRIVIGESQNQKITYPNDWVDPLNIL